MQPGHNCWRVDRADHFRGIQDAADYFRWTREALLVGVLRNILALNNIDSNIQLLIIGLVIVLAAGLQRLRPASAGT